MRSTLPLAAAALLLGASALAQDADEPAEITPQGQAPTRAPPPPPQDVPPPPGPNDPSSADQPPDSGQWAYTEQNGWVWMPYGDNYVSTPEDDSGQPYAYIYAPALGWRWIAAPWVWGIGPAPYFGPRGAWRFHWYRGPGVSARGAGHFHGGYHGHAGHAGHGGGHGGRR